METALMLEPGRSIDDLPNDVFNKIIQHVAAKSAIEVLKCKRVSRRFRESCEKDEVFRVMETDSLHMGRYWGINAVHEIKMRCRAVRNPNILFIDGMNQFFYFKNDEGKQMIEEASAAGNRDATFALGMLMLAEGEPMKLQALQLLNSAYPRSSRKSGVVRETMEKVQHLLSRRDKRIIEFHPCDLKCKYHPFWMAGIGFVTENPMISECDICVWAGCYDYFHRSCGEVNLDLFGQLNIGLH